MSDLCLGSSGLCLCSMVEFIGSNDCVDEVLKLLLLFVEHLCICSLDFMC